MKLSIDLSPAQADRLRLEAERLGLAPEDLASAAIVDLLATTGDDFQAVGNHPFVDGSKRVGHAAMETLLVLNGAEIDASVGEQERVMLDLAAGRLNREQLAAWLRQQVRPLVTWLPATVTVPGLVACLYCRWLPRVRASHQPSFSRNRISSPTFTLVS